LFIVLLASLYVSALIQRDQGLAASSTECMLQLLQCHVMTLMFAAAAAAAPVYVCLLQMVKKPLRCQLCLRVQAHPPSAAATQTQRQQLQPRQRRQQQPQQQQPQQQRKQQALSPAPAQPAAAPARQAVQAAVKLEV
jgi:hypothetical protein